MNPQIIRNGLCTHLVIDDQSPEAVALVEAILAADQAVRKEGVTEADIRAVYNTIDDAQRLWCRAHGFKGCLSVKMALSHLLDNLRRAEARHATA